MHVVRDVEAVTSLERERVRRAFRALRDAQQREPSPSLAQRREWLTSLRAMAREKAEAIASAASADFGHRSLHESKLGEIWLTVSNLSYLLRHFEDWVLAQPKRVAWPFLFGRAEVRSQPKGVVGIIAPWNYPFMLAIEPLAGALAAGNRVLLKVSEHTPRTSQLIQEELEKRLPATVVTVLRGGAEEGRELSALPLDHLLFTGGTAVGKQVYEAAAKNLVPVTLELGGKSPAILHESYSLQRFAKSIISGKCFSAGQSCVAPDYLLVPEGREPAVVAALQQRFAACFPRLTDNPDYTSPASPERRRRLIELRDDAVALGARAVELNPASEPLEGGSKLPLTLLLDVPERALVLKEEIFGPLLPIVPYRLLSDAIGYVNTRPRPLALYYFDDQRLRIERVLNETVSGGVTVNETLLHFINDDLPRSAVGDSGIGAYRGRRSFDAFSHQKSVFYQSRVNGVDLLLPPYRRRLDWVLRFLIGR